VRKSEAVAVSLVILASVGTALALLGFGWLGSAPSKVELHARAPERGNWSPQTIELERGKEVTLVVRNVDVVSHGFYQPDLNINAGVIKAGEQKEITFTPDTTGEFTFFCSVWCSDHHMHMRGTLVVK
jgi:cytochrome c oxidase subunit 2